jgi:hypothetical protein
MAYTPFWAKNCKVRVGAFVYAVRTWTVTVRAERLDGMSSEDGGFEHPVAGPVSITAVITSFTNASANPYANPPNLIGGATVTGVKLYQNDLASGFWDIPTAFIPESSQTADVRQLMADSVTLEGVGTWNPPA